MASDGLYRHLVEVQNRLDPNSGLLQGTPPLAENAAEA